jgi:hypothetical protein
MDDCAFDNTREEDWGLGGFLQRGLAIYNKILYILVKFIGVLLY